MLKSLPVGVDLFEKLRTDNRFYIDKTRIISDVLTKGGDVNLFTRPRRFGKTLTMSMLKCFFETGSDPSLFEGLDIMQDKQLCEEHMGKYPVIFLTLKGVDGLRFEDAYAALQNLIGNEADRFDFLSDSDKLTLNEKERYKALIKIEHGEYTMSRSLLADSLAILSQLLTKHYGKKTILLIDEYDVPLDKAYNNGYYDEMVLFIRSLFGNALKTNPYLQFAVLTGCLRISKESIFTGLNNMKINTFTDTEYDEFFGFTDYEVDEILSYYGLEAKKEEIKEWYDGYRFGDKDVYCPWDVINYCSDHLGKTDGYPKNYWANTSGNDMVRVFIHRADGRTKAEVERLIAGEAVVKEVRQELTYRDVYASIENLWSVLFTTGYLTFREFMPPRQYSLVIPNEEVRDIFVTQVREWFREKVNSAPETLSVLYEAVLAGDEDTLQRCITDYLKQTISIRDTASRKDMKENFYHGFLLGILSYQSDWIVKSNRETGDGYSDILIQDIATDTGVVIEIKYAENANFEAACEEAGKQIESKHYDEAFYDDGMEKIVKYGIAFYKKRCVVKKYV